MTSLLTNLQRLHLSSFRSPNNTGRPCNSSSNSFAQCPCYFAKLFTPALSRASQVHPAFLMNRLPTPCISPHFADCTSLVAGNISYSIRPLKSLFHPPVTYQSRYIHSGRASRCKQGCTTGSIYRRPAVPQPPPPNASPASMAPVCTPTGCWRCCSCLDAGLGAPPLFLTRHSGEASSCCWCCCCCCCCAPGLSPTPSGRPNGPAEEGRGCSCCCWCCGCCCC